MAQQRAWIATGLEPPPPDFMPYGTASIPGASIPCAVTNEETTIPTTNETTQNDGGQRTQTEDGLEGAEAKLAADGLMSAALAMAGAGAHRGASAKKSTAEVRKEETRVALERAALEAGEELSDDSVDDGMDDLDDVDLVSPGWRNGSSASNSKFASSRPGPGLNVGLNVKGVGGYVTGVSSPGPLAAPRRMGGPSQFDTDASAPASAAEVRAGIGVRGETNPKNPTKNPTTNPNPDPKPPPLEAARGVVVERAKDGESDPIRDVPNVARGAAILRRLHGPEDGYRSKRESSGDPGAHGALGFPEDENLRRGVGAREERETKGGTNDFDDDFVRVGALAKSHRPSLGLAARTSEVRDMRAAFALMSNARSPLHAARMSDKMLNDVGWVERSKLNEVNDDPFAPSPGKNRKSSSDGRNGDFRESASSARDGDRNDDPFAPSPPPRRGNVVAMQTAGLSGTFLDAAKADAKADKGRSSAVSFAGAVPSENSSAMITAVREATRMANLDTSFAPAAGEGGATHVAAARRTAVMAAARSAAFEYGAASKPPPTDAFGRPLEHNVDSSRPRTTTTGGSNPALAGSENPRLPVPAVGDDVDVASGLRKAQLDAAARRAMTVRLFFIYFRTGVSTDSVARDLFTGCQDDARTRRSRFGQGRGRFSRTVTTVSREEDNEQGEPGCGGARGLTRRLVGSVRRLFGSPREYEHRAQAGHRGGRRELVQALPQGELRRRPRVAQAPRHVRRRRGQVRQHPAPRRVPKRPRAAGEDVRPLRRRRERGE